MGLTTDRWSEWPELLQRVAEACGAGVALRLAAAYGGTEVYIPQPDSIDEGHHLALNLGLASAREIAATLRVGKIIIPMGPASTPSRRAEVMRRMRRQGLSNAAAAKALGVHQRTVEYRHQRDREQGLRTERDGTPDLFESD